jgi:hypothetical protein
MANQDNFKTNSTRETHTNVSSGPGMPLIVGGLVVAVAFILWLVFGSPVPNTATTPASDTTNVTIEPPATEPADTTTNVTIDPAPDATADPAAPAPDAAEPAEPAPTDGTAPATPPANP